jgi:hypothetical protein
MNRIRLYLFANLLAGLLATVALFDINSSSDRLSESSGRLERCDLLAEEIGALQQEAGELVVVAPESFDPSIPIASAVKTCGLYDERSFSVSETGLGTVDGTAVQRWRINIAPSKMTLKQSVQLISQLTDDDTRFQVGAVRFDKLSSQSESAQPVNAAEIWTVDFREIVYLKQVSKNRK